jgi:hypothetical protein
MTASAVIFVYDHYVKEVREATSSAAKRAWNILMLK